MNDFQSHVDHFITGSSTNVRPKTSPAAHFSLNLKLYSHRRLQLSVLPTDPEPATRARIPDFAARADSIWTSVPHASRGLGFPRDTRADMRLDVNPIAEKLGPTHSNEPAFILTMRDAGCACQEVEVDTGRRSPDHDARARACARRSPDLLPSARRLSRARAHRSSDSVRPFTHASAGVWARLSRSTPHLPEPAHGSARLVFPPDTSAHLNRPESVARISPCRGSSTSAGRRRD
ncbi:hypothetical protein DFH06DRAFT_1329186 [Mycena polygramma]|nr:hypothetical protein DFH06DRAFT_1329186 [Mycena polygramma]